MIRRAGIAPWAVLGIALAVVLGAAWFGPDPYTLKLDSTLEPPGPGGLLGTDELGRSIAARLLRGAQFSLSVMVASACGAVALGALMGAIAGWAGGWVDRVVGWAITFVWSVPVAVFAVLVLAIVTPTATSMIVTIVAINWVSSARIVRSATIAVREAPFVLAARAHGFGTQEIFTQELLPSLWPVITLLLGFSAAEALALEGGLSFLGAGPAPPTASWGAMLVGGLPYFITAWWVAVVPAVAMILSVAVARIASWRLGASLYR
jgi:peptide/nickel transport system permease protein